MTIPTTTRRTRSSLARDLLYAARYYLWRPRVLLAIAAIAIVAGLALNWNWLVAAGLAPILISTLPCLIMCAFGVCMMCRSGEKSSAPVRDGAEAATPPATLAVSATDRPATDTSSSASPPHSVEAASLSQSVEPITSAAFAGCCQGSTNEIRPEQTINLQPNRERRDTHA